MKIAIIGSRHYPNLERVTAFVDQQPADTVIVSGGAMGVDTAAEREANCLGLKTEIYLPNWEKYGKAAGPIRNKTIVDAADQVVAFYDGVSRGTKNAIDYAKSVGKEVYIFYPNPIEKPEEGAA